MNDTCSVILVCTTICFGTTLTVSKDADNIQQYFSSEQHPTLWRAIPALEELLTAWEAKKEVPKYAQFNRAIEAAVLKVKKYYNKLDDKPVFVLALGTFTLVLFPVSIHARTHNSQFFTRTTN